MKIPRQSLLLLALIAPLAIGQEWSPATLIPNSNVGSLPRIIAVGDTFHLVYSAGAGTDIIYYRSTNSGRTWSLPRSLSMPGWAAHSFIMKYGSALLCIWNCEDRRIGRLTLGCCSSTDAGLTWTTPRNVLDAQSDTIFLMAASNYDSVVNVEYNKLNSDHTYDIYNVRSTNIGQTWSSPSQIMQARTVWVYADQVSFENYVHFVWSGVTQTSNAITLFYNRSTDEGLTWQEAIIVHQNNMWTHTPAIAVNQTGELGLVWSLRPRYAFNYLVISRSTNAGDTWNQIAMIDTAMT
jgi:hypothetical protein